MAMVYEYNVVAGYSVAIITYDENTKLYPIKLILIPLKEGINNIDIVKVNAVKRKNRIDFHSLVLFLPVRYNSMRDITLDAIKTG